MGVPYLGGAGARYCTRSPHLQRDRLVVEGSIETAATGRGFQAVLAYPRSRLFAFGQLEQTPTGSSSRSYGK